MEQKKKAIILLAVVALLFLFLVSPYVLQIIFTGSPVKDSVKIKNYDSETHSVSIEMFDLNDKLVFKENYTLKPNESVSKEKSFFEKYTLKTKKYNMKVVLDDKIIERNPVYMGWTDNAIVDIYWKQDIPIRINTVTYN